MTEEVDKKNCGKCERLAKIVGHPHLGYCIRGDCLVGLGDTERNKNEHCFVPRYEMLIKNCHTCKYEDLPAHEPPCENCCAYCGLQNNWEPK